MNDAYELLDGSLALQSEHHFSVETDHTFLVFSTPLSLRILTYSTPVVFLIATRRVNLTVPCFAATHIRVGNTEMSAVPMSVIKKKLLLEILRVHYYAVHLVGSCARSVRHGARSAKRRAR